MSSLIVVKNAAAAAMGLRSSCHEGARWGGVGYLGCGNATPLLTCFASRGRRIPIQFHLVSRVMAMVTGAVLSGPLIN